MSAYILQLDAKCFYPGTWDKMTPREQAERQAQLHAFLTRQRGNAGVTPRQQDFLQSIPAGGNRGNIGTEKTIGKAKAQGDNPQRLSLNNGQNAGNADTMGISGVVLWRLALKWLYCMMNTGFWMDIMIPVSDLKN